MENVQPIWKEVPKFVYPITATEGIDSLESKLNLCSKYATKYNLTIKNYTESLKEISRGKFIAFLKNASPADLPLYANINPPVNRIVAAAMARCHQQSTSTQNPLVPLSKVYEQSLSSSSQVSESTDIMRLLSWINWYLKLDCSSRQNFEWRILRQLNSAESYSNNRRRQSRIS